MSARSRLRPDEHVSLSGWFFALASLFAAATLWVVYDEMVVRRPWKAVQAEFNRRADELHTERVPVALRQITNPDLGVVDRCTTCHVGIDRPELAAPDVPEPYRAHPRLEEGLLEAHPVNVYGCTVCHGGQGMQTKGVSGAAFDHGRDDPFWERPLLRGALVESTCFGCHSVEQATAVTSTFAEGRRLYEDLGCQGCHEGQLVDQRSPTIGPPLDRVRSKHSPGGLIRWIRAPHEMRPKTRMPDAWPEPLGPSGRPFADDHPIKRAWRAARDEEPRAIAAFLASLEPAASLPAVSESGDPARGRRVYRDLGCAACHEEMSGRILGPELAGVGAKASKPWLHAWLADPRSIWAEARMPDFRLTDRERVDLVAHLSSLRDAGEPPASGRDADWPDDAELVEKGRALVREHGCFGCHAIPGFESEGRAGPTLVEYGARTPDLLDWGAVAPPRARAQLPAWTALKIRDPRRFRRAGTTLKMPKYRLTDRQVEALTVFVLADRPRRPLGFHAPETARARAIARGDRFVERLGCRTCHEIGRTEERHFDQDGALLWIDYHPRGGHIRRVYGDRHLAPPTLTYGGLKLRYPWVFEYLRAPTVVRPWLPGRMPTYALSVDEAQTFIAYLAAVDNQSYPFRETEAPELSPAEYDDAVWLFTQMQCVKCHRGGEFEGDPAELAPDLALARARLTPAWIRRWLLTPQSMEPGTRMPTFFPLYDDDDPSSFTTPYADRLGGDVHRQVDALVALTLAFGTNPQLAEELQNRLLGEDQ